MDKEAGMSGKEPGMLSIPGIDTAKGIAATGGTAGSYRQVLSMFCKDVNERLQLLRFFLFESASKNKFPEKHRISFITQVHALKSASASLGAAEISAEAGRFEDSGRAGDLAYIMNNLNGFIEHLAELVENISTALEPKEKSPEFPHPSSLIPHSEHLPLFIELAKALKSQNALDIDRIMSELGKKPFDNKIREAMEQISDQILMAEFESAVKTIDELVEAFSKLTEF